MRALSEYSELTLLAVASAGNVLGSVLNYWMGWGAARFQGYKWFPVSENALARGQAWFSRWGQGVVLLAWVPIIGDPITVAAGMMRMRFLPFVILVSLSKTLRYMAVLGLFNLLT
jgi:membrane protein YqaA with SNARE-associated domain